MKIAITAAVLSLALAFSAGAAEYQTVGGKQLYACQRGPVDRVALTAPAPCCEGQMVCSQFLSTNTLVRGKADTRT